MPRPNNNLSARAERNGYNKRRQKNPQRKKPNGNTVKLHPDVVRQNGFTKVSLMKNYYKNKYIDRILYWKVL